MTTRKRRWTNDEDEVLITQVRSNPNNLAKAFRATSDIVGRSPHCVEQRWYTKIRHTEVIFMTVSSKTKNTNTKVTLENKPNNTEEVQIPIWRRILRLLGL